jgi:toxin-antitoxin system PIN domain toxin
VRALLDVNVLIALLDGAHSANRTASAWMAANGGLGWATCAITQNGCLRVLSHPGYPGGWGLVAYAAALREATSEPTHEFWAEDVSVLDPTAVRLDRVHGPRQLTDVHLLALAVRRGGRLVTFDRAIPRSAVPGATPDHLVVL